MVQDKASDYEICACTFDVNSQEAQSVTFSSELHSKIREMLNKICVIQYVRGSCTVIPETRKKESVRKRKEIFPSVTSEVNASIQPMTHLQKC